MASRGSILRRPALSSSHAAADLSQSSGDEDDDESGSDVQSDTQTPQSSQGEPSEDGGVAPDFAYPSFDAPHTLVPNSADPWPTTTSIRETPIEMESANGASPVSRYKYVHSSWKNGESVMLRHVNDAEAEAINTVINHFNTAVDMHGDPIFADLQKLYFEIVHMNMDQDIKDHVLAACGFRLNHEKPSE